MELRLDGPRRSIREVDLTGGRLLVRRIVFGLAMLGGTIALVALPFARHTRWFFRSDGREEHHVLTETMYVPLLVVLAILLGLWWTSRGRLQRVVLMSLLLSFVSLCTMIGMAIQHFMSSTESNVAELASYLGLFGVFVMGGVIFVVEWFLVVAERNKLERSDPVFPTARVVER